MKKRTWIIALAACIIVAAIVVGAALVLGVTRTKTPATLSAVYIQQTVSYNGKEPESVEITEPEDIKTMFSIFGKSRWALRDTPSCPIGALKIVFVYQETSVTYYPATDECGIIGYNGTNRFFKISNEQKGALCQIWQKYGFLDTYA